MNSHLLMSVLFNMLFYIGIFYKNPIYNYGILWLYFCIFLHWYILEECMITYKFKKEKYRKYKVGNVNTNNSDLPTNNLLYYLYKILTYLIIFYLFYRFSSSSYKTLVFILLHIPIILQENNILINKDFPIIWKLCTIFSWYLFFSKNGILNFKYKYIHYLSIFFIYFLSQVWRFKAIRGRLFILLFLVLSQYIQTVFNPI